MAFLRRAFVGASIGWAALLPLAPFAASQPAPAGWWYALAFAAYGVGSVVCHQLPERSFYLWSAQLPVCARCTGIYVGVALTATAYSATTYVVSGFSRTRPRTVRLKDTTYFKALLAAAAVPTAMTLVYEWTTGVVPSNIIRAVSGAPLGAAVAFIVVGALRSPRRAS